MIIICSNNFEWVCFFFPQFLACRQTGVIPQQDLAKFGYNHIIMKVENYENSFDLFLLPAGTCNRNLVEKTLFLKSEE